MDLFWEGHDTSITPEGMSPQYINLLPGIVQPDLKLETERERVVHPSRLRVLVKSSMYMRNGWLSCAVMPTMCVLSGCFGKSSV